MLGSIKSGRFSSRYETGQHGWVWKVAIFLLADTQLGAQEIPPNVFHVFSDFFQL